MRQSVDGFTEVARVPRDKKTRVHARVFVRDKSTRNRPRRDTFEEAAPWRLRDGNTRASLSARASPAPPPLVFPSLWSRSHLLFPSNLPRHNSRHGVTRGSRAQPLNSRSSFQSGISQPGDPVNQDQVLRFYSRPFSGAEREVGILCRLRDAEKRRVKGSRLCSLDLAPLFGLALAILIIFPSISTARVSAASVSSMRRGRCANINNTHARLLCNRTTRISPRSTFPTSISSGERDALIPRCVV